MLTALILAATLQGKPFRPPAIPLVTHDPYFSIWSEADHPYDDVTRHWTHAPNEISIGIRIDDENFRLLGKGLEKPIPQLSVQVTPTRTSFDFENAKVHVKLSFTSPLLPDNLEVLTRPLTYVSWEVRSVDGATRQAILGWRVSPDLTTRAGASYHVFSESESGLKVSKMGGADQRILGTPGDGTRIDWGYFYGATPLARVPIPGPDARGPYEPASGNWVGMVAPKPSGGHFMLAYDELYEVKYFGQKLVPYWKRNSETAEQLLAKAEKDYPRVMKECEAFDKKLTDDLTKVGGAQYAQLCALAYRQAFAATGIAADAKGQPLLFTKENTSNGDIATVDVIFPMDPMLIALCPALAKASLVPDLDYAASDHWKFPNAPHDLGTYPIANGTDDGGEGMPVEESGNMLILVDAIAQAEGNGHWADKWWPKLTQWETYLEKYGYDPEDQLCTDDFMGHLAHNSNLAIKAILGIAAYGDLCRMRGDSTTADKLHNLAKKYAAHWMEAANDGDHTRLAFDKPNTWSQKYNLVWDHILGLNVFPPTLAAEEVAFYKSRLQPYGVPLDSRTKLTKTDWSIWSASLATDKTDFEALVAPIYNYMDTTTNRQPMVDSYVTNDIHSDGMHARSVVGGIFIRMLDDRSMWLKWAHAGDEKVGPWAAFPKRPEVFEVIPSSRTSAQTWSFTLNKPVEGWQGVGFDDSTWKRAPGPFGSDGTPGIRPGTQWTSDDIWLRRTVTVPAGGFKNLQLLVYHDEDIEVYANGVLAGSAPGYQNSYEPLEMTPEALKQFKPGTQVVIAVHCHQTTGGQGVDVGVVDVK